MIWFSYSRTGEEVNQALPVRPSCSVPCGLINESITSNLGDCERTDAIYFKTRGHSQELTTAAVDGISDCPGEPWDTSIPRMVVCTFGSN